METLNILFTKYKQIRSTSILLLGLILIMMPELQDGLLARNTRIVRLIGNGIDMKDPKFHYIEKHKQVWRGKKLEHTTIKVFDKSNRLLVVRELNFSKSRYTPDFLLTDYRIGQKKQISWQNEKKRALFYYRGAKSATPTSKTDTADFAPVIYDGIYFYILDNLTKIIKPSKHKHKISFADAKLQSFIDLEIHYKGNFLYKNKVKAYQFVIYPSNRFFRLLVSKIEFVLAKSDRRLLYYQGPTNFNNRINQRNFDTQIEYRYQN